MQGISRSRFLIALFLVGLVVPLSAQQFYATSETTGQLELINLGNKTLTSVYTAAGSPDSILINSQQQLVYDLSREGILALYDPVTQTNTVLAPGLKSPRDLVFDVPTACNPNANANTMLVAEYSIGQIIRYNFTTGTFAKLGGQLGSPTTGFSVDGLAYDAQGNLFAIANHNTVVQLDPCTGQVLNTLVLEPHDKVNGGDGMVYDPYSGQLWISHDGTDSANGLIEVPTDLSSFALFQVGQIPVPDGIASDGKGNLYIGAGLQRLMVYNIPTDTLAQPAANSLLVPGIDSLALIPGTSTSTALTASPNPAAPGEPVTLTATITPTPTGTPLGTVIFYNGSTLLDTEKVNASGVATFITSSLPPGTDSLTAAYSGNINFAASTSPNVDEIVTGTSLTPTSTALAAFPNPAAAGQSVTLTATITPTPTGASFGSVNFYDGSTLLGTGIVNASGVATTTTSNLAVGSHNITASYSGNAAFAASTSPAVMETVNASSTPTITTLSASPNPAVAGQSVTLSATITPTPTGGTLGTVSFNEGATLLGTGNVNASGVATFTISSLAVGSHNITASYSGNAGFGASASSPLTLTVGAAPTFTVKAPQTPVTVAAGASVNVNVSVSAVGGGYSGVVTMSSSGLPADATITFNPATVVPGNSSASTIMTIQTTTQDASIPAQQKSDFPFTSICLAASLCLIGGNSRRLARSLPIVLAFAVLTGGTLMLSGCGGGGQSTTQPPQGQSKTYVVTVSGTSGSLSASTTFSLIVQ
ncbi:MAG: Multicopper oxidase [Acidobacteriaceae bacterium]|nr:Multicopper oxidase [Acidobacteriaceae bacterium]